MTASTAAQFKTKAETALSAEFERALAHLPGGAAVHEARRAAMAKFAIAGLPQRRIEEWKYTDLRTLMKEPAAGGSAASAAAEGSTLDAATFVFVDGRLVRSPVALPAGVTVTTLGAALAADPAAAAITLPATVDSGARSLMALNTAFVTDGAIIGIADGARPERPIELVFVSSGAAAVRSRVDAGAGSEATVVERHISAAGATRQENSVLQVVVGDNAVLHHVTHAATEAGTVHLGHVVARIGANAIYKPFQSTVGEGLARLQHTVTFAGEHSSFDFAAATLARGNGHADTTMVIEHAVPNCTSRELFKAVLDGNGRAVFQGKVIVAQYAQKTDGKQMAQALMLSPTAEFDSKPELEIYADDVVCGHGSTCAEIDPDLVFYCRSRGIPEAEARALLIESFVGEAIDKIDNPEVRRLLSESAMTWLGARKG